MWAFAIIAYPISRVLDYLLGQGHTVQPFFFRTPCLYWIFACNDAWLLLHVTSLVVLVQLGSARVLTPFIVAILFAQATGKLCMSNIVSLHRFACKADRCCLETVTLL